MTITEKAAYIKGLAEGLDIDNSSKEGKVIAAIIDLLADITVDLEDTQDACAELAEQINAVDEDLAELEEIFYDECDDCDCDCDDCCDCDEDMYEVECPNCGEVIYFDEEIILDGEAECPACGETLEFDCECECDCCEDEE